MEKFTFYLFSKTLVIFTATCEPLEEKDDPSVGIGFAEFLDDSGFYIIKNSK